MSCKDYLYSPAGYEFLKKQYVEEQRSSYSLSEELKCYPNLIRRALIHHGLERRTRSEAQKVAIEHGRHQHPTEGRKRTQLERQLISQGLVSYWETMSDEERDRRAEAGKKH